MSKQYEDLIKAMDAYCDDANGFGVLHIMERDETGGGGGQVAIQFPKTVPFYYDDEGNIILKGVDSYPSEVDRLNSIAEHRNEMIELMTTQVDIYQTLAKVLVFYDKLLGVKSFRELDKAKLH